MNSEAVDNAISAPDEVVTRLADYVLGEDPGSELAYETAYYVMLDSLGCALQALTQPECRKLLGPEVPGTQVPGGARVPGTPFCLTPTQAAFNLGAMIRWLDYNDTWLAAEWGHPSDNLGGLLPWADFLTQQRRRRGQAPLTVRDLWQACIQAHEIQGVLALHNSFNKVGLDHVVLVKVATAAVATALGGGSHEQVCAAISQAWLDGQPLRTYRHAPNVGSRKSWAAGDATSRGLWLAQLSLQGEPGYRTPLSAPGWGFCDVYFGGKKVDMARELGSYVMENILFKVAYPAEFHAQTAVEAAIELYPQVEGRWQAIDSIEIATHEAALRIISKQGPLHNPADRDHCLQYMVAVALLYGDLQAEHYQDAFAYGDPLLDTLRQKMRLQEEPAFTQAYYEPGQRAIANRVRINFADGSPSQEQEVWYPLGHPRRRQEGLPLLWEKFLHNLGQVFGSYQSRVLEDMCRQRAAMGEMPVDRFMEAWRL